MAPVVVALVKIWGLKVGAVSWTRDQPCAEFEFESSFLQQGLDLSPIHMGLEDAKRFPRFSFPGIDKITFKGLPGMLANSLPDNFGNKIIDSWLTRQGRDPKSFGVIERLCYIGTRGMGALEYEPEVTSKVLRKPVDIDIENLMKLAQEVMSERSKLDVHLKEEASDKEKSEALLDILRVGTSAGGAVPKAIIAINNDGHIISGQSDVPEGYDHWILKFDGISETTPEEFGRSFEMGRVEYAYYLMARNAGLEMMECRLLEENGRAHFLTKRYDRIRNDKVHVLSLAGIGHYGWNPVGTVGYEDAFYVMRELGLPYPEQEQQFRRMVFNALTRNVDDHTKNISYMMDKEGTWSLSPAYDVTLSYDSVEMLGDRHKIKINGKQSDFTDQDFIEVANNMCINKPDQIIEEITENIRNWPSFAREAGVASEVEEYISELIQHHRQGQSPA